MTWYHFVDADPVQSTIFTLLPDNTSVLIRLPACVRQEESRSFWNAPAHVPEETLPATVLVRPEQGQGNLKGKTGRSRRSGLSPGRLPAQAGRSLL
jgi:hypothetical protein